MTLAVSIVLLAALIQNNGCEAQVNYRLSQPQIYLDDGHIYLIPAEHRNLVLVANGTGKIIFNEVDLTSLVSSVKNSSRDLEHFKSIFGAPTNTSAGLSQRISSLEQTLYRLNLVDSLDSRLTIVERQLTNGSQGETRQGNVNSRLRRLRNRIVAIENRLQGVSTSSQNPCSSTPCANGGSCIPTLYGAFCWCREGWEGPTCTQDVNECANFHGTDLGCQNQATCVNKPGGYECQCRSGWVGIHCTRRSGDCASAPPWELCGHGVCVNQHSGSQPYTCICEQGWRTDGRTPACTVDIDECTSGHPSCSVNPPVACINTPGSYVCGPCPAGYTGNGHRCSDVNECLVNNGGCSVSPFVQCINTPGSRTCGECPPGFMGNGVTCQYVGMCQSNNGGCHPLARCMENPAIGQSFVQCICPPGYVGYGMGPNGCVPSSVSGGGSGGTSDIGPPVTPNPCAVNPCANNGRCTPLGGNAFSCLCMPGFIGITCQSVVDPCQSQPCRNGGTCVRANSALGFTCSCGNDFTGDFCQEQVESCGGLLTTLEGVIQYPHNAGATQVDGTYHNNVRCTWTIRTTPGKAVNMTFTRFHLEGSTGCDYDSLSIRDGDASGNLVGKFCGETLPHGGNMISTHNEVTLIFSSDFSATGLGFEMMWNTSEPVCGGLITNQTHGSFNSPGYPGNYPQDRNCVWDISVSLGKRIQLVFATFRIEEHPDCNFDFVEIRDGWSEHSQVLAKYCNSTLPPPLVSSGPYLSVRFHSDIGVTDRGFHITFAEVPGVPGCGGVLTSPTGVFSSPQHPEPYAHGLECDWLIRLPSPDDRISLTFLTFELEGGNNCVYDSVEVHDGNLPNSPLVGRYCGRTAPPMYVSRGNTLLVTFKSDESVAFGGFSVKYETVCGGMISTSSGVIKSPYYPQNYPKNRECVYVISQPPGKSIILDFQDFDVEGAVDTTCYFDYVEVRDGDNSNSSLIGHYCGPPDTTPERIVSTYNYLWIKFKTDGSIQNRGFFANFSTVDTGCGGIFRDAHGVISSPGHPEVYPHGVTCTWIIRGEPGQIVRLNWAAFSMEAGYNCRFDSIEIWDNTTLFHNGTSMGRYCGSDMPPILTTSDNTMTIVFRSDHSVAHDGFMANYVLLNSSTVCGGEFFTEYGLIRSPRYPELYPNRKTCVWKLRVTSGRQFMLNVQDFEMENGTSRCIHDYMEIRNGLYENSPLIGRYCGTVPPPARIPSFSNTMMVKFVSDSSVPKRGFMIVWDATTTGCGGTLNAPQGSIVSPNYPQAYGGRTECIWTIQVSQGSSVQMIFADLDIQRSGSTQCYGEHVEIRDGGDRNARLIGRYCHSDSVLVVNSTGNIVRIKFVSGSGASGRGFHINYRANCNRVIKGFHGVIESPNFPNPYPHNRNCTWTIEAPTGNSINISFSHFDVEQPRGNSCVYDLVEISEWKKNRHGSENEVSSLGKFCGDNRPSLIASTKNTVAINFISDHSLALNGFRLEWKVHGCGGKLVGSWGTFTSPNYPNKYPHAVECVWQITTEIGTKVSLNILELDIERAEDCYYDGLAVYGGPDENSPLLTKICHSTSSTLAVTSTGNNMYLKFYSDGSVPGRGFRATYQGTSGGCGGRFVNLEKGFVMSPNYPGNYEHNEDCMWTIEVDPNHVVQLNFMDFEVERHINCSFDYVSVYDGRSRFSPQLLTHCGNTMPDPSTVRSTGNTMLVRLRTDESQAKRGFKANFTRACGARITGRSSGTIVSPNWPGSLPYGTNCSWILIGPTADDRVTLTFTSMSLVPSSDENGCDDTFVEVLDGEDFEAPSVGKFCSTSLPPSIRSSGNALVLRLVTQNYAGQGFRAIYDHSSSACGGQLVAVNGSFTSPNYPHGYPPNMECVWEISASEGNRIELAFRRFEIEASDFCNNDFLEIHEDNPAGRLVGHFCGNEIPSNLTVANKLWILFRTDSEGQAPGFWADFNLLHGNELNGSSGVIESPMYPSASTLAGIFTWRVTVNESQSIAITFDDVDFETYTDGHAWAEGCFNGLSRLSIYDGYDNTAPVLRHMCIGANHDPLTSTGNVVFIEYDKQTWQNWWRLSWNEVQPGGTGEFRPLTNITGCGGNFSIVEGNVTTLLSPYYPLNYLNNLRCVWGIDSPPHTRIKLRIEAMSLESHPTCAYDKLEVYDGREGLQNYVLNSTLCQRTEENRTLLTSGRYIQLIMQTDADTTFTGFNISVSTECGGYLREPSGRITSPGYPGNYIRSNCEWYISVRPGRTIQIAFETLDIYNGGGQDCVTDMLILRNGGTADSPLLGTGRICGTTIPVVPETSGNKLYLKFTAATHSRRGFALTYSEVSVGCGGEIYLTDETSSSTISSPNFPQIPPPHSECEWFISAPQGKAVQLTFQIQFQIQTSPRCESAGVELRDGGTTLSQEIGTFCRAMPPGTQKSTGNLMYVRYYSNVPEPGIGFKAEAKIASCGGTIMATWSGSLASPGFPTSYETNLNCTWTLRTFEGSYFQIDSGRIQLSLNDLNCTKDRVIIYEELQPGHQFVRNWTWCNQSRPRIETSSNVVHIRFETDNIRETRRGFQLYYRVRRESCGETMRTPTGIIQSPGYPRAYPHNRYCTWRIIAPEDRRVRLEFLDFDLEETYVSSTGKKFCYDALSVYQGQWRDLPPLYNKTLCGPNLPPPVESTSNRMSIYFSTDGSLSHRGFKARYTTELPRLCGGAIPVSNGSLVSPNTTTGTPNSTTNVFCDWNSEQVQDSSLPFRSYRGYSSRSNGTTIVTVTSLEMGNKGAPDPHCSSGFLHITPLIGGFRYKKHCETGSNAKIYLPAGGISVDWEAEDPSYNFSLTYETSPCGGQISGPANISSPPSTGREIECIWILDFTWGSQAQVSFTDLDIDDHRDAAGECDRDYVLVRNGKTQSSPELGKFCGSNLPPDITSMTNSLWIEYHKSAGGSSSSNRRGFQLTSVEVLRGCGGVIHTKFGQVKSPNLASTYSSFRRSSTSSSPKYEPNTECEWIIETVPGYKLNLVFLNRFEIESSQNCSNDFIQLWTKNGKNSPSLWSPLGQKLCGRQLPAAINTTSTSIKVLFRSNDNLVVGDGFTLAWYSACGGVFGKDDTSGSIQSAHYNAQNHSSWHSSIFWGPVGWESTQATKQCDYVIQGQGEKDFIVVEFLRPFDVNVPASYGWSLEDVTETCPYVNVTMREGNASLSARSGHESGVFCGNEPPPVFVGNGAVTIKYNYRPVYQNLGWRAKYAIYKCGGEITSPGRISSPGHPFTSAPNMNCTWKVIAPANRVVRFKFELLELEFHTGCSFDFVKLFEGDSVREDKLLGTFCGNMSDDFHRFSSKSNVLTVQFKTDWSIQRGGFAGSVDFSVGEQQGCGGTKNVTGDGNSAVIRSVDSNGDNRYDEYLDCQWLIAGPEFQALEISFETFNIEARQSVGNPGKNVSSEDCPYDYLEIRDGPGPFGQLLGKFCGGQPPPAIASSQNFMWIRFVTDGSNSFSGFRARIINRQSPCGRIFAVNATKDVQVLTSPGYPSPYGRNIRCKWIVDGASFFDEVDIRFIELDIPSSPDCSGDRLEIKDVLNSYTSPEGIEGPILFSGAAVGWRHRRLGLDASILQDVKYCGTDTPPDFFSVGRSVELVFHSTSSSTTSGRGFKIEYKAAACNRTYDDVQGRIFSPEYPSHSPIFTACQFSIRSPTNGSTISLYFNKFMLPGISQDQGTECVVSAFEVRESTPNGPVIAKYCGTSRPSPVFSRTNVLWVKYYTRVEISRGYDITYTSTTEGQGCGGFIFHTGGSFTSPFFPGNYSRESDCRWRVKVPSALRIHIEFTTFSLVGNCATDFVELLSADSHYPSAAPALVTRYCMGDIPSIYVGTTDSAVIRYKTSANNSSPGWRAEFKGIPPSQIPQA